MTSLSGKIKAILAAGALVSIVAVLVVFLQFRQQQSERVVTLPKSATKALMKLAEVQHTAAKNGITQLELTAVSAQLKTGSKKMILESPEVTFFLEDGTKVHLTAEQGVINTRTNDIQVNGDVKLNNNQYTLITDNLVYEHNARILESQAPVRITGESFDLKAASMTYSLDTNQAHFVGEVEGNVYERIAME